MMTSIKNFRRAAGATGATIVGTGFFFTIIGVFGLRFAIAGLVLFVAVAVLTYSAFTGEEIGL
jgi:hypothetical protein